MNDEQVRTITNHTWDIRSALYGTERKTADVHAVLCDISTTSRSLVFSIYVLAGCIVIAALLLR